MSESQHQKETIGMIVHFRPGIEQDSDEVRAVCARAELQGLNPDVALQEGTAMTAVQVNLYDGEHVSCSSVPEHVFEHMEGVTQLVRVTPALVSVASNGGERHTLSIGETLIGNGQPTLSVIGPCTVDRMTMDTVAALADAGVNHIRGGCWKPRSKAMSFRGYGEKAVQTLLTAAAAHDIASVWTEVLESGHIDVIRRIRDEVGYSGTIVLWVGARNIGNTSLLEALGRQTEFTVMLKNGIHMTDVTQLFDQADFVVHGPMVWKGDGRTIDIEASRSQGNQNLILCVRGLQSHDKQDRHRFAPNFGWIDAIHQRAWTPVCLDPSHMAGELDLVFDCLKTGLNSHPDVVMVEAHIDPDQALCDAQQAVPISRVPEVLKLIEEHNAR